MSTINLMTPSGYMASIDWKDAYYSVPVDKTTPKISKICRAKVTCINSLACQRFSTRPCVFTKIMKPIYSNLRRQGYLNVSYIDNSHHQGDSITDCVQNVLATTETGLKRGFAWHPTKSVFEPPKVPTYQHFCVS